VWQSTANLLSRRLFLGQEIPPKQQQTQKKKKKKQEKRRREGSLQITSSMKSLQIPMTVEKMKLAVPRQSFEASLMM